MQPPTPQINPYGAPQAPVGDYVGDQSILERARSVPAGHALSWYREAWRLFKVAPGAWVGLWVVLLLMVIVLSVVPIVGGIAVALLTPVFIGGATTAARRADLEGIVRVSDLFASFNNRASALLLIGLLQMLMSFAVGVVFALVALVFAGGMFGISAAGATPEQLLGTGAIVLLVIMGVVVSVIFVPITNAVWLASCLAALHDVSAVEALRRGFSAAFRNLLPLLLLAFVSLLLAIVASIPLALGWLVLGPVILCVVYAQYRDLFGAAERPAETAAAA